jgi:Tfp pilus assembly protein PilN
LVEIIGLLPGSINLSAVNHQGESVTISGTALDEDDIFAYVTALGTRFPDVAISSITAREEGGVVTGWDFALVLR